MRRALAPLAACALVAALWNASPAFAEVGNSNDNSCTTSDYNGNTLDGSWTRGYNPNCSNITVGSVTISWHNYVGSDNHHYIKWNASVSTGAIEGNDCIYVALDWQNPNDNHSDAQFTRNCYENSVYAPSSLPQVLNTDSIVTLANWPVQRLQIGTYDPDTGNVKLVACPGSLSAPPGTNTDGGCTDWLHLGAATWSSKAAKIYRKANDGTPANNDPTYPDHYTIGKQVDPDN